MTECELCEVTVKVEEYYLSTKDFANELNQRDVIFFKPTRCMNKVFLVHLSVFVY